MGRALLSHYRQHEPNEVRYSMILLCMCLARRAVEDDHAAVQQQAASADGLCQLGDGRVELVPSVSAAAVHINRDLCCAGDTLRDLVDAVHGGAG